MKNICLVLLIGLPAAGKTTFCNKFEQWLNSKLYNIKIYHFDEYLDNDDYRNSRSKIIDLIKTYIENFQKNNDNNPLLLILDDNMMYKSMRNLYLKLAKELEISYANIFFKIDLEVAIERNDHRNKSVPSNILLKVNEVLDPPHDAYQINTTDFNSVLFEEFLLYVKNRLSSPLKSEKKLVNVPVTEQSLKHKVDLILRSIVNNKIKKNNHWEDMNLIKIDVYNKYKNGEIHVDPNWNENEIKTFIEKYFE